MGGGTSKFILTPGFQPSNSGLLEKEETYEKEGILVAYREAMTQIQQDVNAKCCTISGTENKVKYWRTDGIEAMAVQEVKENTILCYHESLKIKFPVGVANEQISAKV